MEKKTRTSQQQSHLAPTKRNPKGDHSRDAKKVTDPHPGSVSMVRIPKRPKRNVDQLHRQPPLAYLKLVLLVPSYASGIQADHLSGCAEAG